MSPSNSSPDADSTVRVLARVTFTTLESEILRLIAAGHRSRDVADILAVSKNTVDFHVATVFRKLGVNTRVQAVSTAWGLGLLPFEPPFVSRLRC